MLHYAVPNAPQFQRPPSVFADPPTTSQTSTTTTSKTHAFSIPRPASALSQHSNDALQHHTVSGAEGASALSSQPALSTLAFLAASAPALSNNSSSPSGNSTRSSTPASQANMSSQYAPAATPGGSEQTGPPVCANCSTSTTPLWRRDESGSVLCNACGLFLKLHGRPRPISLKTDVIKSRNRVKTSQTRKRDSQGAQDTVHHMNGFPAAHPDSGVQRSHSHRFPMGMGVDPPTNSSTNENGSGQSSTSPPIFDSTSLPSDTFASPRLSAFALRHPSPGASTLNASTNMEPPQNYETLVSQNNTLRTRVSELEVINDLFRGRVAELEGSEQEARHNEYAKITEVQRLTAQLQAANARAVEMETRLAEFEAEHADSPSRKKQKTADNDSETIMSGHGASTTSIETGNGDTS